jgi:ergothioneine biosynthesis protein EgtB
MHGPRVPPIDAGTLADWVRDARARTLDLVADLSDAELLGPRLTIVNPLLWEIGHVAWFQEFWVLRHVRGADPMRAEADRLWDSAAIAHDVRWDLLLPTRQETLRYLRAVQDRVVSGLHDALPAKDVYFVLLSVFHEDMHAEAITYTRQTHGYPAPRLGGVPTVGDGAPHGDGRSTDRPVSLADDVLVPGGSFVLGAAPDEGFVFDNEKWGHEVAVAPFAIARLPVTQAEFAAFVDDGGYRRPELWSVAGWRWREAARAAHPVYWRADGPGRWLRRVFDRWHPLEPHRPVVHVCWYEAEAWCRWAGRRLPTELEWEAAASGQPDVMARALAASKRRFPWGDTEPTPDRAALDGRTGGTVDVAALAGGDSAFGSRQMIGNVWEWTESTFEPYPGFERDPYKEYSAPWFGTRKVLRGGCWATRARLIRNTWRNFYEPHRSDVWAGFRTCAVNR